ncbi:hypothetical protein C5167_027271 [Papaver somniferum]|nr:hypothetical protein C5167_027271 [Papaver somniferum]
MFDSHTGISIDSNTLDFKLLFPFAAKEEVTIDSVIADDEEILTSVIMGWKTSNNLICKKKTTISLLLGNMAKGLLWATAEDLARNRGRVLSLYRQILRSLNSPKLPMNLAARLAKKAEARAIFMLGAEEESLHNIEDLIDTGEYALSLLRKGEIPKYIQ